MCYDYGYSSAYAYYARLGVLQRVSARLFRVVQPSTRERRNPLGRASIASLTSVKQNEQTLFFVNDWH